MVCLLSDCSGGSTLPRANAPNAAFSSGVRLPASYLATRRSAQDLGAAPDPLSALAYPLSALAYPLSALAYPSQAEVSTKSVCLSSTAGPAAKCTSSINLVAGFNPNANAQASAIPGVQPGLLQYAYNVPNAGGNGVRVAAIVAYDDPNAESDLAIYRNAFGMTPCTTANGCFKKLAGTGATLPVADSGWSVEASLDLDAISALCQQCSLMLVEAASNQIPDLAAAVDTAVANGAQVVSNSYGVPEAADNVQYASHYEHPGIPMTASAGDVSYGVQFPADVPSVTAVGGTTLQQITNDGLDEVAWPLTGSGCSAFFAKPAWQKDAFCTGRTTNDVAMLADPADGISVYDSTLPGISGGGWSAIGGTSEAASLVAALYAIASKGAQFGSNAGIYATGALPGKNPSLINITAGSDGTCTVQALCNAGPGYNGPTGNGVPWGTAAFAPQAVPPAAPAAPAPPAPAAPPHP